jgi:hypothetical protein
MYNDIKLEKGLYNLSGKSFTSALEELDPSSNYCGTPLERLDAYERQLKRFNIRISGQDCDRVEKFFTSTESAVLFPEFVTRSIKKGFDETVLSALCAAKTVCESGQYLGCVLDDTAQYNTAAEASVLPTATVRESSAATVLTKYGRLITASYEAIRQQRLDVFSVMLKSIGVKLAAAVVNKAVSVLVEDASQITASSLTYAELAKLYGKFDCFNLNTLIVSPATASSIVAMDELSDISPDETGKIVLPFGAELVKTGAASDNTIIGIDKSFALEFITSSDLVLETDKLIDRQLECITVSITCGFRKITPDAVKVLSITE